MGVPKRKSSKRRCRVRRAANAWRRPTLGKCPNCDSAILGHIACPNCGVYRGRQVLAVEA